MTHYDLWIALSRSQYPKRKSGNEGPAKGDTAKSSGQVFTSRRPKVSRRKLRNRYCEGEPETPPWQRRRPQEAQKWVAFDLQAGNCGEIDDGAVLASAALNQDRKFRFGVTAVVKASDNLGFRVIYEGREVIASPLIGARVNAAFHWLSKTIWGVKENAGGVHIKDSIFKIRPRGSCE